MPTATVTTTQCQICRYRDSKMSILKDICLACYDQRITTCATCGDFVTRNMPRSASIPRVGDRFIHPGRRRDGGELLCGNCYSSATNHWRARPLEESSVTYDEIRSTRKFGVEIETSFCPHPEIIRHATRFGCKYDSTISGREFDSPILYGDAGLAHVRNFLAAATRNNWRVNEACGCHTHYDMRDESEENLWQVFYAYRLTGLVWEQCVSERRLNGTYCRRMDVSSSSIRTGYESDQSFSTFSGCQNRYDYINVIAYLDHRTFEVRLLEGQLDPDVICNWITLHCRFIDRVRTISFPDLRTLFANKTVRERFAALTELINDKSLIDWLASRAMAEGSRLTPIPPAQPTLS